VVGSCKYGDESAGSSATELVSFGYYRRELRNEI
jgi:hypothetical protein